MEPGLVRPSASLTLLDWRRSVASMYGEVRATVESDPPAALRRFRSARDTLFRSHPDSPIPVTDRASFEGLAYWPYDAALRFIVPVEVIADDETTTALSLSGDAYHLRRIGRVRLPVGDLDLYWIDVYGGGLFLPFRDATSGTETYAAGRYVLDTIKGADLGGDGAGLVIDLNYAYHPSCAYDPIWSCPLAPPANRLTVPIRAGERLGGVARPDDARRHVGAAA
jgi:uncharacterized protein (DUF1684 family)